MQSRVMGILEKIWGVGVRHNGGSHQFSLAEEWLEKASWRRWCSVAEKSGCITL